MEKQKPMPLHRIEELLSTDLDRSCLDYLSVLMRARYVDFDGIHRAASGEPLPAFRLLRHTGPDAPYVDETGDLVDTNLHLKEKRRKRPSDIPTLRGRMRVWMRIKDVVAFDKYQCRRGMEIRTSDDRRAFDKAWTSFLDRGELITCNTEGSVFQYKPDQIRESIRNWWLEYLCVEVTAWDMPKVPGKPPRGALIRSVIDEFRAEGYRVEIRRQKQLPRTFYTLWKTSY